MSSRRSVSLVVGLLAFALSGTASGAPAPSEPGGVGASSTRPFIGPEAIDGPRDTEAPLDGAVPDAPPESSDMSGASGDTAAGEHAKPEAGASEPTEAQPEEPLHLPNPRIPPIGTTQMWFRSTSFVDYFGNNYNANTNDDRFVAFVNYVNVGSDSRFKKWELSTLARVDTSNVFNTKTQGLCDFDNDGAVSEAEAAQCRYEPGDYRLERVQVRAGNKYFEVTAGDVNVNFGRGVALSVRKIADIGVDAAIKGGRVDINTKHVTLTGVGGVANRNQTDFATRTLFSDPGYPHALCERTPFLRRNRYGNPFWSVCSDIISGGRVEAKLPGKVRLGTHYVFIWFGEQLAGQFEGLHLVGGDLGRKRIGEHWDFFAGVTGLLRNAHHRTEFGGYYPDLAENGIAAYTSNALTFGNTFVLIEGKYYDNYLIARDASSTTVQYAEAPTLERADQIIPAAANTAGARLLFEHTLEKSRVTLVGNYLGYAFATRNEEDMFDPDVGEMMHHGYAGLRWRNVERGSEVQAFAGYRWEGYQRPPAEDIAAYVRRLPHAELYVNQLVGKTRGLAHSVSLRADWRYEQVQKGSDKKFHRGNIILGYGLSPIFTLALIGGFSSEFAPLLNEPRLHDQPCSDENNCNRKPHLWPGAELRINFLESSFLRVFAGRQVGGLLCVNGSCRTLPDFEGVRTDLILSF